MRARTKTTKGAVMVFTNGQIQIDMKDTLKIVKKTEKALFSLQMAIDTKVIMLMIRKMGMVYLHGIMGLDMKDNIRMISVMVRGH